MATTWFNPDLFPFTSRFMEIDGNQIHYIGEGSGPTLLFLHANPTWSYQYRNMIAALKDQFRCVALDYPGFGLSEPSEHYKITLEGNSRLVEKFISKMDLKDITLVAHDASVSIGMGVVVRHPEWFRALALANGFAWSMKQEDPSIYRFLNFVASPIFRALIVNFNMLTRYFSSQVGGGRLSKAERLMYVDPTRARARRKLQHDWFRSIVNSESYLTDLRARLDSIREMPVLLTFADDDPTYKAGWVERYQSIFDNTCVALIHESDHFPQEHNPDAMVTAIREWYGEVVG